MGTHYEEALISLKRKYGKDDLIRAMIAENNKLKAQIDELDEIKHNVDKYILKQVRKELDKRIKDQDVTNTTLRKQIEQLKKDKTYLITKLNAIESK